MRRDEGGASVAHEPARDNDSPDDVSQRLRRLAEFKDQGLITENEFQRKRSELIDSL